MACSASPISRSIEGVPVPIFWRGEQVGERRWYNDRLTMFLLRHRLPHLYGPLLEPGISANQTDEMRSKRLQFVVPAKLHETYRPGQREWLMTVASLLALIRERQGG